MIEQDASVWLSAFCLQREWRLTSGSVRMVLSWLPWRELFLALLYFISKTMKTPQDGHCSSAMIEVYFFLLLQDNSSSYIHNPGLCGQSQWMLSKKIISKMKLNIVKMRLSGTDSYPSVMKDQTEEPRRMWLRWRSALHIATFWIHYWKSVLYLCTTVCLHCDWKIQSCLLLPFASSFFFLFFFFFWKFPQHTAAGQQHP